MNLYLFRFSVRCRILIILVSIFIFGKSIIAEPLSCSGLSEFKCANGERCISRYFQCDGARDCSDGSDETNCSKRTCATNEFACGNGQCVMPQFVCDGQNDCFNFADERNCTAVCATGKFKCKNSNYCLPDEWKCDGQRDCLDGSDEEPKLCESMSPKCDSETEFTCANRARCITKRWRCDGEADCADASDERGCPPVTCKPDEFRCTNGECIKLSFQCDGEADCKDKSDENRTVCEALKPPHDCPANDEFACGDDIQSCIPNSWKCDGHPDCHNGRDENAKTCGDQKVTPTCSPGNFKCALSGECIPERKNCDGVYDCADFSDEKGCLEPPMEDKKCDEMSEFDCDGKGTKCISRELVCNTKRDCPNGEDEQPLIDCHSKSRVNECATNNGGCGDICVDTYESFYCKCKTGYQLAADKKTCVDIDECLEPHSCSQKCFNTKGGFKCTCEEGYTISPNNPRECKAIGQQPSLVISNRYDIREYHLRRGDYKPIMSEMKNAVGVDYDVRASQLFWSDVVDHALYYATSYKGSGTIPPTDRKVLLKNVAMPDGIAFDWLHKNLYWTDASHKTVSVISVKTMRKIILVKDKLHEPRAIVVDPHDGWMYWTDWGDNPKIEKCGLNGERRQTIVENKPGDKRKTLVWPNGLALDHIKKRIYWVDAKIKMIASSDLFGRDIRVVLSNNHDAVGHPFAIDIFEDTMYYSDWDQRKIHAANKFTGERVANFTEIVVNTVMDLKVHHILKQPPGDDRCSAHSCAHMCLPAPRVSSVMDPTYTCHCMEGFDLRGDMKSCNTPGNEPPHRLNMTKQPSKSSGGVAKAKGASKEQQSLETSESGSVAAWLIPTATLFLLIFIALACYLAYRFSMKRHLLKLRFENNSIYGRTTEDNAAEDHFSVSRKQQLEPLTQSDMLAMQT